jgi:geranylgeranylglycerol-phosphate geranylgeranyltransferase
VRRSVIGLILVTRPGNVALTAASVVVGGVCAGTHSGALLVLAAISAGLIAAGGYAVNDLFDREIDRVNRPDRPLPRGDLSPIAAGIWATILLACGLVLAQGLGPAARAIALCVTVGLVAYAAYLKRRPLVGHVLVAAMSGTPFAYGGLAGEHFVASLVPAVLAALFHLGREMLKAAADRAGDEQDGAQTMAVRWGVSRTCRLAMIPLVGVVALSPLPTIWGWFGLFYLVAVIAAVDGVLLYAIRCAWRSPSVATAERLARLLKWDMVAGLVAVGGDRWANWLPWIGI